MTYKNNIVKVNGRKGVSIFLFALSTCGWCAKAKKLLTDLGLEFEYVYVDLLGDEDQAEVDAELEKLGTDMSFPKIIINDKIISGFEEQKIRKALEKWIK